MKVVIALLLLSSGRTRERDDDERIKMQEEWRKTTTEAFHSPFSFLSPSLASFFFATISLSSAWGGSMKRTRRTRTCHPPPLFPFYSVSSWCFFHLWRFFCTLHPTNRMMCARERPTDSDCNVLFFLSLSPSLLFLFFGGVQRNSISPTEREKYRNARSPMAGNDLHGPDMKKIKREDKDGHVKILFPLYIFFTTKNISHINNEIFLLLFPLFTQMSDGERSDQDLVVDDGGDVITIFLYLFS